MQSTGTTAAGQRKDHKHKGRGDGATSTSDYQGTGVGTSTAVKDSAKPKTHGGPSSSSDGDSPHAIALKKEINRFVARGPANEPVATRKLTAGSGRDRHHQLPGSSARGSKIPPKGHTPATTATQPTTAGSGKRRPA